MGRDTRELVGLGAEELAEEMAVELPERPLMRRHRTMFFHTRRFHRRVPVFVTSCHRGFDGSDFDNFDDFGGVGFGRGFGFGGFGGVSNFNATGQSIFNPQVGIGFGGGGISQFGGNSNFNRSVQFGF
jgi:hypothetical protein